MLLILAGVLLLAFVVNVGLGSITGTAVLGNVSEMLLLFGTSICFSGAVLQKESKAQKAKFNDQ